jgi:hypothetical protein
MAQRRSAVLGVVLALGVACPSADEPEELPTEMDTDPCSVPDSGGYIWSSGSTEIDEVIWGYDDEQWWYRVEIIGWAELVTLEVQRNWKEEIWIEQHEFTNTEFAEDGSWDRWELSLGVTGDPLDQVADESTALAATEANLARMTWMVAIYEDGAMADCAEWGADTEQYLTLCCKEL